MRDDLPEDWWAPLAYLRVDVGIALPPAGQPLRVAFVGQRTYFGLCSQEDPSPAIEPSFVDFRDGTPIDHVRRLLEEIRPHVVVVFRPELLPERSLADLDALVLGILTEPLPRSVDGEHHPDLTRRLGVLDRLDCGNVDRVVVFDPHIADVVETKVPVWRAHPLPVSDRCYRWRAAPPAGFRVGFIGRSTGHRETFLQPAKHKYDLFHVDHGLHGQSLLDVLDTLDVALNLHNEPYPTFENRVALHLAAGHLVISEPLSPTWGLDANLDFVQVTRPQELMGALDSIATDPSTFDWVRRRGAQKAEAFRATRCWTALVHDLLLDVGAFGRGVAAHPTPAPKHGPVSTTTTP